MTDSFGHALTRLGMLTAHPLAFLVLAIFAILWLLFQPETMDWHGFATLATLFMTLVIQRAEHRDTQALHGKLDELLRAESHARSSLTKLDDEQPEEIERQRKQAKKDD